MTKRLIGLLFAFLLISATVFPVCAQLPGHTPRGGPEPEPTFIRGVENSAGESLTAEDGAYRMTVENSAYYTVSIPAYGEKALIFALAENQGVSMLHLSFSEDGSNFRNAGTVSLPLQVSADLCYYLVALPDDMSVTDIRIRLNGQPGGQVDLVAVTPPMAFEKYRAEYPGEITTATVFDDTLSVRGSLDQDASIEYLSYQLVLFALDPAETLADLTEDTKQLGTLSVRQKFDFRVRISGAEKEMKYVVALVGNGEILPLSHPFYASFGSSEESGAGYKGLYAGGNVDPLTAGVQTMLVECDMSLLLREEDDENVRLYITNGNYYYLNMTYINEIASTVDLAHACGMSTVLHLTGTEILSGDNSSLDVLKALVSFLAQGYGETDAISGIILDSGRTDIETDAVGLQRYATALHGLYLLISDAMENVSVYAQINGGSRPDLALCQLAAAMAREGVIPYGVYWNTDIMTAAYADTVVRLAEESDAGMPCYHGMIWSVSTPEQLAEYSFYATRMQSSLVTFAIRPTGNALSSDAISRQLYFIDSSKRVSVAFPLSDPPVNYKGRLVLEEFDRNVSAALWHMSGDVLSFGTSYSPLFGKKVLSAHLKESSSRMLAVYVPTTSLDLSAAPYVHLAFMVKGQPSQPVSGRLIFISGDKQMVHSIPGIPLDSRIDVTISLEKFAGLRQIDAIAISIEGASVEEVFVASLTLYSRTLEGDALAESVHAPGAGDETVIMPAFYLLLGLLGLLTAAVPVILFFRGRDQETRRRDMDK